jgi:hypothetical protein
LPGNDDGAAAVPGDDRGALIGGGGAMDDERVVGEGVAVGSGPVGVWFGVPVLVAVGPGLVGVAVWASLGVPVGGCVGVRVEVRVRVAEAFGVGDTARVLVGVRVTEGELSTRLSRRIFSSSPAA